MSVVIFKFFIFFSDFQDVSGEENMIRLDTTIKNFHEWPRRPPLSPFSVSVVLVKAIVEAVDIRVAQKSRPSHQQIHILCKSQVSMQ